MSRKRRISSSSTETSDSDGTCCSYEEGDEYQHTDRIHLAKQLFSKLARSLRQSALRCYITYLKNSHDVRFDFRNLCHSAERGKYIAERLYHGELGSSPPRFFDFGCVYDHFKLVSSIFNEGEYYTIHARAPDGRVFSYFDPSSHIQLVTDRDVATVCKLRLLLDLETGMITRIENPNEESYQPYFTERSYSSLKCGGPVSTIGDALADLLNVPEAAGLGTLLELADDRLIFKGLPRYHLVCQVGHGYCPRYHRAMIKDITCIGCSIIGTEGESVEPIFLSFDSNSRRWRAFFVSADMAAQAMKSLSSRPPSKDVGHAQSVAKLIGSELDPPDPPESEEEKQERCCATCDLAESKYSNNTPPLGPQKRFARPLDSDDYLIMFGLSSDENREILKQVHDLGIAAFDCEASTTYLRHDSLDKIEPVNTGTRSIGGQTAVQVAQLIGYGDSFLHGTSSFNYALFTSAEGADSMMEAFVTHIIERGEHLKKRKTELLKPLYDYLSKAYSVYKSYFDSLNYDVFDCDEAFAASPWGQFRQHLDRKAGSLNLLALNGERYDFVLLYKGLAQELRSRNLRLSIIKRQSGVLRMSFKHKQVRIVFNDICSMLSPGVSLAGLAKTVGLTETKFSFPFSKFTTYKFLKEKKLPLLRKDWYDSLRGCAPEQDVIDKAHADFEKHNCETVYDYLTLYLRMDVYLLGRSAILLFRQYEQEFGVHPNDNEKSSISSYSANVNQKKLMKGRRIACYAPTHPFLYAATRSSCIGGLTCVFEHFGGQPENAAEESKAGVSYFDYNSLYAHA